ncbi:MAG: hypothetical protein H7227_00200 [Actinobacteria bacterium]|nr:hypothetical protein [Actinomycetota bacterium]
MTVSFAHVGNAKPYKNWLVKVPEVTAFFWIIKILATTVGETFADYLNETLGFGLNGTTLVTVIALIIALTLQFKSTRYKPTLYWLVVVLISIAGTLFTDNLTDNLNVSLLVSSIIFSIILAAIFMAWHRTEASLAIHSIYTPRREIFYWSAILFTFALGTATGDLFAERLGLGYSVSLIIFAVIIIAISGAWKLKLLNPVFAFWAVYVLTRPLGASIGDLLSQDKKDGGIGLGTTATSAIFLGVIVGLVFYLTMTKKDAISLNQALAE